LAYIIHSARSFLLVPYSNNFVCQTFPFCYQDLLTGRWNRLVYTSISGRVVENPSSSCWIAGAFCRSDASVGKASLEAESPEDCQNLCANDKSCSIFSFHKVRGEGVCSLLSSCRVTTPCAEGQSCVTGKATCECPKLNYLPGNKDSLEYSRWTCDGDRNPYSSSIPAGTTCETFCPTWANPILKSTCQIDGTWSPTTGGVVSKASPYSSSFPTPDQPDLECGCPAITFKYDPNDEEGADFSCQGWEKEKYKQEDGWTIEHTDKCSLYCSNEPQPVVTVYCEALQWIGEPEKGFWCYKKPEAPEPEYEYGYGDEYEYEYGDE